MRLLPEFSVLVLTAVGSGYWLWLAAGRPPWRRNLAWAWFALVGYACHTLLLQALMYLDLPVRTTAPWLFAVSLAGVGGIFVAAWRQRGRRPRRRVTEAAVVLAAAALAVAGQSGSVLSIGADRFVGDATIDQVNYVMTAQAAADMRFSTTVPEIGLRPWLYQPVLAKETRLTECVALADAAVLTRTDAQRAWAGSALWYIALLAIAVAGMVRLTSGAPPAYAAGAGLWAALLPVVAKIFVAGFYSQLATLWTFPALIAICRPGAMPARARVVLAGGTLAFLFGAYTEFFPFGAAIATLLILTSAGTYRRRLGTLAATFGLAAVLTSEYLAWGVRFFAGQAARAAKPGLLAVWSHGAGTWRSWCAGYFSIGSTGVVIGGALLVGGMIAAATLQSRSRNRWWLAAVSVPVVVLIGMALQRDVPVYALYKLQSGFAPVFAAGAAMGLWAMAQRSRLVAWVPIVALCAATAASAAGVVVEHRTLTDYILRVRRSEFDRLWAARDRTEAHPDSVYLVSGVSSYAGAWLCYFARASTVYYDAEAISDRRAPSSELPFRHIPAGVACSWLDLNRTGPVRGYEPTPTLRIVDPVARSGNVFVLGRTTRVRLERTPGFAPAVRTWSLECGIVPLPNVGPCRVELDAPASGAPAQPVEVTAPTVVRFRIVGYAGDNSYILAVRPRSAPSSPQQPLVLMQSVSLEAPEPSS